jgi:hypothetical protein
MFDSRRNDRTTKEVKKMVGTNGGILIRPLDRRLWTMAVGPLLVPLLVAACGQSPKGLECHPIEAGNAGNPARSELVGVWLTAPGYDDVKMTLNADGTFTWENRRVSICDRGTWLADDTTLTFVMPDDDLFCTGGTATWTYQLDGDTLTEMPLSDTCPGEGGPSPWVFERQGAG